MQAAMPIKPMSIAKVVQPAPPVLSVASCYLTHHAKVFQLGMRYGNGNAAWAEDLTHDVFVKFAEKQGELRDLDDIGGWLYRVTSNLAISRLRREKSFWGRVTTMLHADKEDSVPGADVVFEDQQLAGRAMAAMQTLPAKERVVVAMKILDDKSQKEIATTLSISEGYVSKLLTRALKRLASEGWEVSEC